MKQSPQLIRRKITSIFFVSERIFAFVILFMGTIFLTPEFSASYSVTFGNESPSDNNKSHQTALVQKSSTLNVPVTANETVAVKKNTLENPIRFNTNFPGAAIGKIEYLGPNRYRCHVDGQYNQFGRNRQPTWFFFRMDGVKGRSIDLTLTNFLGEYNNKPSKNGALGPRDQACGSSDGIHWSKITSSCWNTESKELELSITPSSDQYWIAYIPPYVSTNHDHFLAEADRSNRVLIETYGKSLSGADLKMLTVTDFSVPASQKRQIWIIARVHAWESFTSMIAEGMVRFLIDPKSSSATELCQKYLLRVVIMPDPDSCDQGLVRFNLNGFDLNRSWSAIDLNSKEDLHLRPEVWYLKKQLVYSNALQPIFAVFNLHDHQTGYDLLETNGDGNKYLQWYKKFEKQMENPPLFLTNPKTRSRITTSRTPLPGRVGSMDEIWEELGIPHVLIEYNVNRKGDTDYHLNIGDAAKNGENLIKAIDAAFSSNATTDSNR